MLGRLALRLRHLVFLTTDCRQVDTFIVPDFPVDLCACCMQDVGAARADESGTEVLWVRAAWQNFSIGGGGQVRTVREQGSNRGAMAAPRAAWESVRSRTLATLEEQSRCRGGAKNLFDRPARDPIPSCIKFPPWGGQTGVHALARFHNSKLGTQLTKLHFDHHISLIIKDLLWISSPMVHGACDRFLPTRAR